MLAKYGVKLKQPSQPQLQPSKQHPSHGHVQARKQAAGPRQYSTQAIQEKNIITPQDVA